MNEKKHSILVVDDDELMRGIHLDIFKDAGFEVYEAKDGLEGLNIAIASKPEVIFSGIIMPRMTGFEMLQQLKSNVDTSMIPVIIFSHLGREEDRVSSEKLGAADFLIKGLITPKQVLQHVVDLLEKIHFRLMIEANQLDGPKFISNFSPKTGSAILEVTLDESAGNHNFKARLVG